MKAVDDVSFDLRKGEVLGLVGESGSGKTTLGRTLLGLVKATDGSVIFEDRDITKLSERELRDHRRRMQIVFQDPHASLNPAMTIGQSVGHPLSIHGLAKDRAERPSSAEVFRAELIQIGRDVARSKRVVAAPLITTEFDARSLILATAAQAVF